MERPKLNHSNSLSCLKIKSTMMCYITFFRKLVHRQHKFVTLTTSNALSNDMEHSLEYTSRHSIFMNQAKQKWIEKPYIYIANLLIWPGLWIFKLKPALGKLNFDFLKRIPFFKLWCLKEITSPYSFNIILSRISKACVKYSNLRLK